MMLVLLTVAFGAGALLLTLSLIGALTQFIKAIAALTAQAQVLTDALKTHSGGLMVVASGDALVANRVAALTETLKSPLQVHMVPTPSPTFESTPTKGTH